MISLEREPQEGNKDMQMTVIEAIRIPGDASPRVRTAADELARWVEELGGARPSVGADSEDADRAATRRADMRLKNRPPMSLALWRRWACQSSI